MPAFCKATTKYGGRCGNRTGGVSDYCYRHADQGVRSAGFTATLGGLLGHIIAPGPGGAALGAAAGLLVNRLERTSGQRKKRVFVSFDFDYDRTLKEFLIGQSKLPDSPFTVDDYSLKEAAPEKDWKAKARASIKRADIVLVIVGPKTYRAPGVLAEVAMAREEGKPIVQMIGYRQGSYKRVPNAGFLYAWNWENLKRILS